MMINRFAEPVVRVDPHQAWIWQRAGGAGASKPAGPWGVLEFMRALPETLAYQVDLSLLPLVNAAGFSAGTRFNAQHVVALAACR